MIRQLLTTTALCTSAALLMPSAAAAQSQTVDWSGFYAGLGVTGIQATHSLAFDYDYDDPPSDLPRSLELTGSGVGGTIDLGYNRQSGAIVTGVEGDLTLGSAGASDTGGSTDTYDVDAQLDTLLSLRGRLGLTNGPLLYYATAGIAAGHAHFSSLIEDETGDPDDVTAAKSSGVVAGVIGGVGAEYAVSDTMSLKAEGLVYNLATLDGAAGNTGKGPYSATDRVHGTMLRGGVNFRF